MDERRISTISEYLEIVSLMQLGGRKLWFRGVADPAYQLVPGLIWRRDVQWEGNYVHAFLVAYRAYVQEPVSNPWDIYSLMQHHGLPTRLLDWCTSPLNALFFALTQESERTGDRAVWMLDPYALNNQTLGDPVLLCPAAMLSRSINLPSLPPVNLDAYLPEALDPGDHYSRPSKPVAIEATMGHRRIRGQTGCFTVHGSSPLPIDSYLESELRSIARVILDTTQGVEHFLEPLRGLGINEETIFQDLDALCARIRREQTPAPAGR